MNFYKHFIGDYGKKTAHLSLMEHGAYLLMMQAYYATEAPLPTGKALYRLLRAESKADKAAVDSVVRQFWQETPSGLINTRAVEEIAKARAQAGTNRRIAEERESRKREARSFADSTACRATIPRDAGPGFHGKPGHRSTASRAG